MIGGRVAALQAPTEHEESGDTDQGDERDQRRAKLDLSTPGALRLLGRVLECVARDRLAERQLEVSRSAG